MKKDILTEFDNCKSTLIDFKGKMKLLITELTISESIPIHQITGRVKERNSLEKKIERKQEKYTSLKNITDIVGLRVITYLESDVDKVADLIEKEFVIDSENSIDKRELKSDQFGYRSLHFVIECNELRTKLIEYKRFKKIKFEIQIRSILQHAWAEIEHDLGYKGIISIPEAHKRSFNRVAALLESADLEFNRLKKELTKYESEVPVLIKNQPENVALDQASLISFNKNNEILKKARVLIKKNTKCNFISTKDFNTYIIRFEKWFDITTIDQLSESLSLYEKKYLAFIDLFSKDMSNSKLIDAIPLFYFLHFLSAIDENQVKVDEYVKESHFSPDKGRFIKLIKEAKTIATTYKNNE